MLLALDFAGEAVDVISQPLKISFGTCGKRRTHTPDYLAVTRRGVWLIDVRPEPLIKEADRESFAAAAEMAVACGWRYAVAARWREHAFAGLDAMASRRRLRSVPLRLRPVLLAEAGGRAGVRRARGGDGLRAGRPGPAAAPAMVPAAGRRSGRPAPGNRSLVMPAGEADR
ncbi:hypothetical protein ABZ770_38790 [Streptomyces sp. NPDC006654]|uniref:hypothetical protein n=1 Tax=Streptomyces sp. NPDC006654 TaxID=3156897 RepID=UPI0033C6AD94